MTRWQGWENPAHGAESSCLAGPLGSQRAGSFGPQSLNPHSPGVCRQGHGGRGGSTSAGLSLLLPCALSPSRQEHCLTGVVGACEGWETGRFGLNVMKTHLFSAPCSWNRASEACGVSRAISVSIIHKVLSQAHLSLH